MPPAKIIILPLQWLLLKVTAIGPRHRCGLNLGWTTASTLQIAAAIQPRRVDRASGFELPDLVLHLQGDTDIVEPVNQAVFAERIYFERCQRAAGRVADDLVDKVHFD